MKIYRLEYLYKEELLKQVKQLLEKDRFACQEDSREVDWTPQDRDWTLNDRDRTLTVVEQAFGRRFRATEFVTLIYEAFFQRPKMRVNRDPRFFGQINAVFMCLIATTIKHCLKECLSGQQKIVPVEFKYETAASKYYI